MLRILAVSVPPAKMTPAAPLMSSTSSLESSRPAAASSSAARNEGSAVPSAFSKGSDFAASTYDDLMIYRTYHLFLDRFIGIIIQSLDGPFPATANVGEIGAWKPRREVLDCRADNRSVR